MIEPVLVDQVRVEVSIDIIGLLPEVVGSELVELLKMVQGRQSLE